MHRATIRLGHLMKFLSHVVFVLSLLWLALVGLHHFLWLYRQFALPPRSLWWLMRLPLPRQNADGMSFLWPILIGFVGVVGASAWHAHLVRKEKQRKEGSEA